MTPCYGGGTHPDSMIYDYYLRLIFKSCVAVATLSILTGTSGIKILFFSIVPTSFMKMGRINVLWKMCQCARKYQ